jgi:ABC-type lipoprotein release transport system permease subunit
LGAGIRTWLNVFVLSLAFLSIVYLKGMYNGMEAQSLHISVDTDYGSGQIWCEKYDPYDPLSLPTAHSWIPEVYAPLMETGTATPMLLFQGAIYPNSRMKNVLLRGVDPHQTVMNVSTSALATTTEGHIPIAVGHRMAEIIDVRDGDVFTMQWRDGQGTYDARDAEVVHIFMTENSTIDIGNIWVDLTVLQEITRLENEATMLVVDKTYRGDIPESSWTYMSLYVLTTDLREMMKMENAGGSIMYGILMAFALLAIFDTQVLAIWRRKKEMGTLLALGMTRTMLIKLFTLEGSLYGLFAVILATLYGTPLLVWNNWVGLTMPMDVDSLGMAFPQTLFPEYSVGLILGTIIVALFSVTITSYLPVRKLAKLNPTDALRGKID